jgi:hypothetical protein
MCVTEIPLYNFIRNPAHFVLPEHEAEEHGSGGFGGRLIDQRLHISDEKVSSLL